MDSTMISAVINTKNSAETLERTLRSLSFVDEIVVVDMQSQDNTLEIAEQYTDKVFSHPDAGFVEPARNFALKKATGEWVLVVDSDEVVGLPLARKLEEIAERKPGESADCYYLPRKNIIFGHWVQSAGWWPDHILRFFRNGHVEWSEKIHSVPITRGTVTELPAKENLALLHYNYSSVEEFVDRLNRYTTIQANEKIAENHAPKTTSGSIIAAFKDEFLSRLFPRRGIQGGTHGISLSFLQAFSELVTELKVWQSQGFTPSSKREGETLEQLNRLQKELAYWIADERYKRANGLAKWWWRVQRSRAV